MLELFIYGGLVLSWLLVTKPEIFAPKHSKVPPEMKRAKLLVEREDKGIVGTICGCQTKFKKGEIVNITEKDWLGRELYAANNSDTWFAPEELEFLPD